MKKYARLVILIAVFAALGAAMWVATRPPPLVIQGEVTADRVDISPRVSGRIVKLNANVGDNVTTGEVIAELESPQLGAALLAARATLAVARADLDRINSTRPENIAARKADVAAAQADITLNQETYNRQAELVKTGSTPQSRVDEATRNLEAAVRKKEAAEAAFQLAVTGASKEERALAAAQVKQSEASLNQREVDVGELTIRAPGPGQVTTRVAALGENFSAGAPLFSMIDMGNIWFTFNVREDLLKGLKIGDTFDTVIPALGSRHATVRVTMINVQGQYATWRATRATGDFDLRTFEVRVVPTEDLVGLRPGMSVIAAWAAGAR
ncbi:HlyD family secretion protein [Bradyrhizobium sp. 33ap4]|uniref:HlyD family secretion protein n=1 Tax=Bradyrhizobium sp. 33ap4 TaxID=3061630 RepID=UPI0029310BEB|nr:efflux RND transporter periplasmic adaptor subunit [Bradyrhizobium sp. 33ap4]